MLFMMIAHLFTIYIREIFKKEIALTMPMAVKLMHGIITYTVTNMKAIVCYHIRRSHCAYLAHRKTTLSKVRCSISHFIKKDLQYIGGIISSFPMMFPAPIFVVCKCRICLAKIVHSPPGGAIVSDKFV